jgi:hypothetical protein
LNAGSQFRANCAVTIDSLISAFNVIQFGDLLSSDVLVDEIPEGSFRPQRPSTTSNQQIALVANAVLSLPALVVGSIWLAAAERGIPFAQGAGDSKYQSAMKRDPETNSNPSGR